jgi:hypothetical protein
MNRSAVIVGVVFAMLLHAGIAGGIYYEWQRTCKPGDTREHCDCKPPNNTHPRCLQLALDNMEVIEVQLARKATTESKQPQKKRAPKPTTAPEPMPSENAPEEPKEQPDEPPPEGDPDPNWEEMAQKYMNEDVEEGPATPVTGQVDGHERGWADVDKGHPWLRQVVADFYDLLRVPKLDRSVGQVIACVRFAADATIAETKAEPPGANEDVMRAVKLALNQLAERRADKPVPFDDDVLKERLTRQWTCIRVNATND